MEKILNVLLHIDESENWDLVCRNADELLKMAEIGNYIINVEIVVTEEAVKSLAIGNVNVLTLKDSLEKLNEKGVFVYASSNSLKEYGVDHGVVFPFVKIVPSGVFHIALRTSEGFGYIRP